jgi:hypothetical protein
MYIFYTYNEYIGPYFLSHVALRFSPVISMRLESHMGKVLI